MVVIAGCLIVRDGRILMVKEAKKKCYGQWKFFQQDKKIVNTEE